jgi:tetratricopeptide (TPR) repeat protein
MGQRQVVVRGEVTSSSPILGSLTVELSRNGVGMGEMVSVNPDGSFECPATPGTYELRVSTVGGNVIYQQTVFISGTNDRLTVRLPDKPNAERAQGDTVSVRSLQHKIPAQARSAYEKGQRAAAKGRQEEAIGYFRKALSIDPEFADAHNELGAAYAALKELPQAAEEFQKAIDIAPEHRLALPNLSIVLARMKRFREAEQVARQALKIAPGQAQMRYILAASLMEEHGNQAEALDNLERAANEIPKAHLLAADLLAQTGRRDEAAKHLEEYLRHSSPKDSERPKVEVWLAQLRR